LSQAQRYFAIPPKFDPEKGKTVLKPEGEGYGYWVGGHKVVFDPAENKFYLFYRTRKPLGKGRGGGCCVAESIDGVSFTTIWEAAKEQLDALSIEVGTLIQDPSSGNWRLYLSYQCTGGVWRIDLIQADHPRNFDAWHHRTVVQPGEFGLASIKDPGVYIVGGLYYMFANVLARKAWEEDDSGRRTLYGSDATVLLTSPDGIYFRSLKFVFEPGGGAPGEWGRFRSRLNSIIYLPPVYVGFFDGGGSVYDMYEEQSGVAISHDLDHGTRVSADGPWVAGPHGCVRYIDALRVKDEIWYYYEYTLKDKSHELRVSKVKLPD